MQNYTIYAANDLAPAGMPMWTSDDIFAITHDLDEAKDILSDAKAQYNWAAGEVGTQNGINTVNYF
jgi:hypothetical protein